MPNGSPVVILGAGLTGLSAACHLRVPYRLLEKSTHVGGLCVTEWEQGYGFDRTGHLLHLRDPSIRSWILSLLGEEPLQIQRCSRIWSCGRYTRYPFQANTFGLPPDVARQCLLGFLRAREAEQERERKGNAGPATNFEEFILRFMGEGIARHFMVPYNTKLWGVPPAQMSAAWTDRFVPRPTVDEVVAGAVGCNDQELGYNAQFYYPRQGIGVLPQALAGQVQVELNKIPKKIDLATRQIHMADGTESVSYERLISTIPLDRLFAVIDGLPPAVTEAVERLRVTSLYYLDIAFKRPTPREDLHWVYVPEEKYPFYRVGLYSNFSSALVPTGGASMYVELASRQRPDLDSLLPSVLDGLQEMGLVRGPDDVAFVRLRHLPHAYVIYDQAYRESLDVLHPFLAEQGIFSRGRYGSWEYSAMEDALRAGREVARVVEEDL